MAEKSEEPQDKNLHFLYTRLILYLIQPLVNHWSPLTHPSHCVTTAATEMSIGVSPAMHCQVFLCWMPLLPLPSLFQYSRTSLGYAGLHTRGQSLLTPWGRLKFNMLKAPSRGNRMQTTCPRLPCSSITTGIRTYDLSIISPTPYRQVTVPPQQAGQKTTNDIN